MKSQDFGEVSVLDGLNVFTNEGNQVAPGAAVSASSSVCGECQLAERRPILHQGRKMLMDSAAASLLP